MGSGSNKDRFLAVLALNVLVFAAELAIGLYSGSWAMISDSLHVLIHVFASVIALCSEMRIGRISPAALNRWSAMLILLLFVPVVILITNEALKRLANPPTLIITLAFFAIAAFGLLANIWASRILAKGRGGTYTHSRMALFWHMLFDTDGSLIVIIGAVQMYNSGNYSLDPLLSLVLAGVILTTAALLFRKFRAASQKK